MPTAAWDDGPLSLAAGPQQRAAGRPSRPDPTLRQYVALLRRYWPLALGVFLVVVLASVLSSVLAGRTYRAEAEVLLRTEASQQLFPRTVASTSAALNRSPVAEIQYVTGDAFETQAREAAGSDVPVEVRFEPDEDSSTLVFVAEGDDAEAAAAAANSWAETYVSVRQQIDVDETTRLRDLLVADRDTVEQQRQELLEPVDALDEVIAAQSDPVELTRLLNQQLAVQRSLAGELNPVEDEARRLSQQISTLEVDLRVLEDPDALAFVSTAAAPPDSPVTGSLLRGLLVGLVAGLVLAAVAVSAARHFFHRVTTPEDVRAATNLPVLGSIPTDGADSAEGVEVMLRPDSAASEAYRRVLTALDYQSPRAPVRRLLVTSVGDDEAATAVAVNLAALAGQNGTQVLIVGVDLRHSRVHVPFGLGKDVGVTDVLGGRARMVDAVTMVELPTSTVSVLPSGAPSGDPAQMLRSPAAAALFDEGVRGYDLVVYVGAPVLQYVDSLIVARSVDAALLVVTGGSHSSEDVASAAEQLVATGTRTPGVVVTAPSHPAGRRPRQHPAEQPQTPVSSDPVTTRTR